MTDSDVDAGGRGTLSINDLDALRAAARQFRASGGVIAGLRANTAIADTVASGLPGTDVETGVANLDETVRKALQEQGDWLDELAGKLLGALDQIARADHDAAAGLAHGAPARRVGGTGGGSPSGGSGAQPGPAGQSTGQGDEPSGHDHPTGAEEAAPPVDGQSGEAMSVVGPDGREVELSPEQARNASAIVAAGKSLGVGAAGVRSALRAALRESGLRNAGSASCPESLQYADKRPDGSPWLSDDESAVGLFPDEAGTCADVHTMMDPYAQATRYFRQHGFELRAWGSVLGAGTPAGLAQSV